MKQIPEVILKKFTAEALGLTVFDENAFTTRVDRIEMSAPRHMKFFFKDGTTYETDWFSTSKKDWWTPERKAAISAERRTPVDNPYKKYLFSLFIHCGVCGQLYYRSVRATGKGKKPVWFSTHKSEHCPVQGIPETIIKDMCAEVMEIPEFDETEFNRQFHHADVLSPTEVRFTFRDGTVKIAGYKVRRQGTPHTDAYKKHMSELMKERWQSFREYEANQNNSRDADKIHISTDC